MLKKALLVIDVQVGMFSDENYRVYRADELLKNIKYLIGQAHLQGVPVIFIQHTQADGMPMARDMEGWQIHPELEQWDTDYRMTKTQPDSFYKTELEGYLKDRDINNLIICGLQTEFCIDTTCRRASTLGYETILVKDAHSTFDVKPLKAEQIIEHHHRIMANWFATVVPTMEVDFTT